MQASALHGLFAAILMGGAASLPAAAGESGRGPARPPGLSAFLGLDGLLPVLQEDAGGFEFSFERRPSGAGGSRRPGAGLDLFDAGSGGGVVVGAGYFNYKGVDGWVGNPVLDAGYRFLSLHTVFLRGILPVVSAGETETKIRGAFLGYSFAYPVAGFLELGASAFAGYAVYEGYERVRYYTGWSYYYMDDDYPVKVYAMAEVNLAFRLGPVRIHVSGGPVAEEGAARGAVTAGLWVLF